MKSAKSLSYMFAVAALLTVGLTACGKKSDDNKVGSLAASGNGVSSSFTISGMPVQMAIQNIAMSGYGYSYGYNSPTLNFTIVVNGQSIPVQTNVQFYAASNGSRQQTSTYNGLQVIYSAACYDQACTTVAVEAIFGTGYQYRQFVMKKVMTESGAKPVADNEVTSQTVKSLAQIMQASL